MRAAYIEQTGPPEVIQVGDLPTPEPGPGQVLVRVARDRAQPDRPVHPVGHGRDAAGVPVHHRLRPGRDGRGGRRRASSGSRSATGSGARTRGCSAARGSTAEYAAVDEEWLYPTPASLPDARGRGAWRWSGSRRTSGLFQLRPAQDGRDGLRPRRQRRASARWSSRWPRPPGPGWRPPPAAPSSVELCRQLGADLALNYKTDDIPARLREFAPEGIDVWYETQREPNLEVSIPLLRKRGRMILMAGRTAKPALPLGSFYPRDCSLLGFAMFNATARRAAPCADDIDPLGRGGPAQAASSAAPSRSTPPPRPSGSSRTTPSAARGTLDGKVVHHDRLTHRSHPLLTNPCNDSRSPRQAAARRHEPADDARRLDDGGVPPRRLGPRQDRRLLLPPARVDRRAAALVAPATSSRSPARRSPTST